MRTQLKMIMELLGTDFGNTLRFETNNENKTFEINKLDNKYEITESFENEDSDNEYDNFIYECFEKDSIDEVLDYILNKKLVLKIVLF